MRIDHKRPLLAFFVVLGVCTFIVLNGLRGQAAVVAALHAGTGRVVAGVELVTIRAAHQQPAARELREPPVLRAVGSDASTVTVAGRLPASSGAPDPQPAAPAHPEAGPATSSQHAVGQHPAGQHEGGQSPGDRSGRGHGHHHGADTAQQAHGGTSADHDGGDHQGRAHHGQMAAQRAIHHLTRHLTHGVGRLLDRHAGPAEDRGHALGRWFDGRGHGHQARGNGQDHGRGHRVRGLGHDRGRHVPGWGRRH
jgi:hypothetical protein